MICPSCKSKKVLTGQVKVRLGEGGAVNAFNPDGLKLLTLKKSVPLVHETLSVCTACGHLWGRIRPAELAALIERSGKDELKKRLVDD
ncbi:hypothetical protein [Massilia sp. CCM 8734]|uniref:hypothetical protein n=1 Tax=Massilia sp. CCM 8734 TaxID=2609283 RepID=UPI00141ED9DA|nr:hypothetical protein [Massilia sp. CCM 8734]